MADSEERQKELMTLELKAMIRKIETFRTSLPDKLRIMQRFYDAVFEAGMRAGEITRKKLEAIVEGALAAEGMLSPCSICRPSDEHRHEETCPILDAERFLSKAALPAAPEEKKP